ncbi:MAG: ATP-binding cassette domain-containing protein [Pseudomonadota bacterium]
MLEARGITVRYGDIAALEAADLSVSAGEVVVIVGPNGAGKSTLMGALSGAQQCTSGEARIDGTNVAGMSPHALATRRAVLEQTPVREVPFSVSELIGLAIDRSIDPELAAEFTARALLKLDLLELGATPVMRLSGGQAHRAHMARTLAQLWAIQANGGPGYLMIDEPTASLDLTHQRAVVSAARDAAHEGAGVLVILHDLTIAAAVADRVVLMQDGRILEDGGPDDVLRPEILEPVYGLPIVSLRTHGQTVIAPLLNPDPDTHETEANDVRCNEPV